MAEAIRSKIRVLDQARSVRFPEAAFGLRVADRLDFDDFTPVHLETPRPTSRSS